MRMQLGIGMTTGVLGTASPPSPPSPPPPPPPPPSAWAPDDEASIDVWLDPSDSSSFTESGNEVSTVTEKASGYTVTVTGPLDTGLTTINDLNVWTSDGVNSGQGLSIAGVSYSEDMIFLIVSKTSSASFPSSQSALATLSSSPNRGRLFQATNANNFAPRYTPIDSGMGSGFFYDSTNRKNETHIFQASLLGSSDSLDLFVDGVVSPDGVSDFTNTLNTTGTLKILGDESGIRRISGDLGEVLKFDTNSSSVRQKAEGYLAHKWGVEGNLAVDHPYKSAPPSS